MERGINNSNIINMNDPVIFDNERIDDLQIKGCRIIQKTDGFCFGMDAVLLSDYARVRKNSMVTDLCSGTGIIPILLDAKYDLHSVEGIEYFPEYVGMAERSIRMNGQEDRITMKVMDVRQIQEEYPEGKMDYVTCNPPYMKADHGLVNGNYQKAAARHELLCTLTDVVEAAAWLLKQGGHFTMVHRPFRLAEIISECKAASLEPKRLRLVYPAINKEPNMLLIDCIKGARQRITVDPPLIIYNSDGSYTEEVYRIYGMIMDRQPGEGH